MKLVDPNLISVPGLAGDIGIGRDFAFPFVTIEDVVLISPTQIGVFNDNNYPFSIGRHVGSGRPDDDEFILINLDQPLQTK
jgi:glycerophosphoryl diester phosphodiesterase